MTRYIGNGAYCYANSAAMLLAAAGETVAPGTIEVLSGVGLGASLQQGSTSLWFGNLCAAPDIGISKALELLGFDFTERAYEDGMAAPIADLRAALEHGPVVLGPLDMGYLSYMPGAPAGADHFVLVHAIGDHAVELHDPAGFPYVSLRLEQLEPAWRAERIPYRRGAFRMWAALCRGGQPDEDELWTRACEWFAQCYHESDAIVAEGRYGAWLGGSEAIRSFGKHVASGDPGREARDQLGFVLPMGAKRADDYAAYFGRHDAELAGLKHRQAALFGRGHVQAVQQDWPALAATLGALAAVEDEIRAAVLERAPSEVMDRG